MYGWYKFKFYVKAAIFIVLLGVLFTGLGTLQKKFGRKPNSRVAQTQPVVQSGNTNSTSMTTQPANISQMPALTLGDIQRQLIHATKHTTEASTILEQAIEEAQKWQNEIEPLRAGDAGMQVAAFPDLVQKMNSAKQVTADDSIALLRLRDAQKQMSSLKTKVDSLSSQSDPTALTAHEMASIESLHELATDASIKWTKAVADARAIFTLARTKTIPVEETNLKEREDIVEAESRLEVMKEDEESSKKQREAERQTELDEQKKKQLAKQEREKLIAKAHSTEVLTKLAPFLQPRTVQPRRAGPGTVKFHRTTKPAPMSLSTIQAIGALDNSIDGLKWLARITGSRQLSSPRWSVYSQPNSWSDADLKMLTEGQELLREYGPILVETGRLSP